MAHAHVKKNDVVVVISGAAKGKTGKVLRVDRDRDRVVIEGVNMRKKAVRRSQKYPQGGIIDVEAPLHISKVMQQADHEARRARRVGKGTAVAGKSQPPEPDPPGSPWSPLGPAGPRSPFCP